MSYRSCMVYGINWLEYLRINQYYWQIICINIYHRCFFFRNDTLIIIHVYLYRIPCGTYCFLSFYLVSSQNQLTVIFLKPILIKGVNFFLRVRMFLEINPSTLYWSCLIIPPLPALVYHIVKCSIFLFSFFLSFILFLTTQSSEKEKFSFSSRP